MRGSNTAERSWWDVTYYKLRVNPDFATKTIKGSNEISFTVDKKKTGPRLMQIDLQVPMKIDSVAFKGESLPTFNRSGNVYYIRFPNDAFNGNDSIYKIYILFSGKPLEAVNPPWDGGWIWKRDQKGRPWMTVACQGLGASVWYPCKDYQGDEPDSGASLSVTVPDSLVAVGNGRLALKKQTPFFTTTWEWEVKSPINSYNIVPYIGAYVNWKENYKGLKGNLDCNYWVLDYNLDKSKRQFGRDVKLMLKCFEDWFGPYPFYEDGYKLVETPHLGMEHQSAIAYGNEYQNGYLGMDRSATGWGDKWDYIIVHESGHEWFGNNITTRDIADMWVHEGFTTYSETLFIESRYGKKAANTYTQGLRSDIKNDVPIIGPYGVNKEGSVDMYDKGSNLIHMIRQIINNDVLFKEILRGLNKEFYHKIITSGDVEKYIIQKSKKDLAPVFDQYLRTKYVPILEWKKEGNTISYHWTNCNDNFTMPVKLTNGKWLTPTTEWKTTPGIELSVDKNFYIGVRKL